jgi:hypothetical protein
MSHLKTPLEQMGTKSCVRLAKRILGNRNRFPILQVSPILCQPIDWTAINWEIFWTPGVTRSFRREEKKKSSKVQFWHFFFVEKSFSPQLLLIYLFLMQAAQKSNYSIASHFHFFVRCKKCTMAITLKIIGEHPKLSAAVASEEKLANSFRRSKQS